MRETKDVLLFETVDFSNSTKWKFWLDPKEDIFFITAVPTIQQFDKKESTALARTEVTREQVQVHALINQVHIDDKQRNALRHLGFFVCRDIRIISHQTMQHNPMLGIFYHRWYEVIVKKQYELVCKSFESTLHGQTLLHEFLAKEAKLGLRRQQKKVKT